MEIPKKLKSILEKNQPLYSAVMDVMTSFQAIFEDNKLFFFEEYTDHGIHHIENVLKSAEFIISDESYQYLSSKDVAILVLAVILHDIGMHTEYSTFIALINGEYDKYKTCLDNKSWLELWNDYLSEAKRFSSAQKRNIFGNEYQPFYEPNLNNKDNLNGYDKKLIGEFVRRYHARLAHEIAFNGLIGENGKQLKFGNEKLNKLYRGMAGIVARSHGMELRNTFSYLEHLAHDSWHNPDDVNIVFLMVVLRIADYIQIDNSRVNPFLVKLKTFNSPVSLNEHKAHLAIESVSFKQKDKERFYVVCAPECSSMLVKLNNLFIDIQKELDTSWAVLGEVYGFLTEQPKIKFRRISSNLESKQFLDELKFVPRKINFHVNNELSKLLISPLYGNRATYGARELVQNAVDACRERKYLESHKGNHEYEPRIAVSINRIDEDKSLFEITDNGKGMELDEILHYFLSIGASFRKSLMWRKQYIDDDGHTLINRNGKFGIGILAAFLIGEVISVKTRKKDISYFFEATLDSEFIEIKRDKFNDSDIGTTISLCVSNQRREELLENSNDHEAWNEIKWTEWYIGDAPIVEYFLDEKSLEPEFKISKNEFNEFNTEIFKNIRWQYIKSRKNFYNTTEITAVACNDILISKDLKREKSHFKSHKHKDLHFLIEKKPSFLFNDPDGLFPIKLDRNDIDCIELPFENELLKEVSKSFISLFLNLEIDITKNITNIKLKNANDLAKILFSKDGYTLNIDYFINKLNTKSVNLIRLVKDGNSVSSAILNHENALFFIQKDKLGLSYSESIVAPSCGGRIILNNADYTNLFKSSKNRITKRSISNHKVEQKNEKYTIYNAYNFKNRATLLTENNINILDNFDKSLRSVQEVPFSFLKVGHDFLKAGDILTGC